MSRRALTAKDPNHIVIVGWDGSIGEFLGVVTDRETQSTVKRVSCPTISGLRKRIRRFAEFSTPLCVMLADDRSANR
jgi:hypothetical protein